MPRRDDIAQASLPAAASDLSAEQLSQADSRADEWMKKMKKTAGQ